MPSWDVHFNIRLDIQNIEMVRCIERVRALASVIRGIPIPPGVQDKIDALNIMRAVRGTTGIEGTELSEEEVQQIMEAQPDQRVLPESRQREEQEARNAQEVMRFVASFIEKNPTAQLTEGLICEIHKLTTQDINYPNNTPGVYRSHPVHAGDYLPPKSGDEVRRLMREFVQWFNSAQPTHWDPLIRAIVAHFYIISIHPFGDGNGRTSRAVESALLYQAQVNARGFYSLANFYYMNRPEYVNMLDHVRFRTNGDLTPFVLFALKGLVSELDKVYKEVLHEVRVISFRDFAREQLLLQGKLGSKAGERMFYFLVALDPSPVSIKELRSGEHPLARLYRKVTSRTLARDISFLKEQKLIVVKGDEIVPNLEIMTQFVPPRATRMSRPRPIKRARLK